MVKITEIKTLIDKCVDKVTDIFYPKICYLCNAPLQANGLCHECWNKIIFIENPTCKTCANPFAYDMGDEISCAQCMQNDMYIDYAKTTMKYDKNTRKLIMGYKNHNCFYLTNLFCNLMNNAIREWVTDLHYIIPIPLHHWRFFWRGYNQAAVLAKHLSKITQIPCLPDGLLKVKWTQSQSNFNKEDRKKNILNAFEINHVYEMQIKNKNILIIDDVTTTGATLNCAAKILKKSGVRNIYCTTIAKSISF